MKVSSQALKRQTQHSLVKNFLRQGELEQAMSLATETIISCGPHVGLLCDLAATQYELGLFSHCVATTQLLKLEYKRAESLLSKDSSRRTALFLAKLLEEQADLPEAFSHLQKAESLADRDQDRKVIQSQQLRILSWLGEKKELSVKYLFLTEHLGDSDDLAVEILHGLMWAEASLFGFSHAVQRWQALQKMEINFQDTRLIHRDFLEIALLNAKRNSNFSLAASEQLQACGPLLFDRFLISLMRDESQAFSLDQTDQCSMMMRFRILILQMQMLSDSEKILECRRKFFFLLNTLSTEAAVALEKMIPHLQKEIQSQLILVSQARSLNIGGVSISLTPLQTSLLKAFVGRSSMDLGDVSLSLWGHDYDSSHYHRIRMLVYKTNELLQLSLGIPILEVRKAGLRLNPQCQIIE